MAFFLQQHGHFDPTFIIPRLRRHSRNSTSSLCAQQQQQQQQKQQQQQQQKQQHHSASCPNAPEAPSIPKKSWHSHREKRAALLDAIKACGKRKDHREGARIHAQICAGGPDLAREEDVCILNALISMYSRCGELGRAREVFEGIRAPNVVSWNALISGYTQNDLNQQAMECFQDMERKGVAPNPVTFACILKACGSLGLAKEGGSIHGRIGKLGFLRREEGNVVLGTALVDMYSKCGMHRRAREVLDELPIRTIVSWNALLVGYVRDELADEAMECLAQIRGEGLRSDAITFVCMLKACAISGSLELGEELHAEITAGTDDPMENDTALGNALVDMYAKCGALAKARSVFDRLPMRNAIAWTSLISGYARHGLCAEALRCYREMAVSCQTRPDMVAVSSILKACGELKLIEVGEAIHAELGEQAPSIRLQTALVDMYIGCGALGKAQLAFDRIREPDVVLWTLLMSGYVNSGSGDEALGLFWSMLERGFAPDTLAFACILKACSSSIGKGEWLHACCRNLGLSGRRHHARLVNALVDMYAKNGILAKAKQLFDELTMPDIVSWNALLTGYAQFGRCREALALVRSLMTLGTAVPNEATFLIALSACSHGGLVEEGEICFDQMAGACGVKPAAGHYACMVDLFGRAGRFDKAVVAIEKAPPLDRVSSWVSLLSSCRRWAKIELGRWSFEHLMRLDAKHAGAYVCIDNLYAMSCMGECEG